MLSVTMEITILTTLSDHSIGACQCQSGNICFVVLCSTVCAVWLESGYMFAMADCRVVTSSALKSTK